MSIRIKIILIIISALIAIGLPMGLFIYRQNNQEISEHANADIKSTIDYATQLVNFYLGTVENNLTNLANDPIVVEALETKDPLKLAQVSEKMTIINETVDNIENIGLHEIRGSSCALITGDKDVLPFVGTDFSQRDYCQGIIKTKASYLSSAYVSVISHNPVLGLVVPVKDSKGEMIGYVLGSITLSGLRGYLSDLQSDSAVDLLDRYGTLFLSTKRNIDTLGQASSSTMGGIIGEEEIVEIEKRLADNQTSGYFRSQDEFVGYKFNGVITVVFEKYAATLLTFSRTLNLTIFLALSVAAILMIIVIYIFVGRITKRISRLSSITQQIAGGEFNIKLEEKDLKAKDETAVLVRAFNVMAAKLTSIYKDLENKVKQRTVEVEEKNKKLAKSESEFRKALDTSERTNKLMVGRELKMKELKEELKKIKKS